MFHRVRLVVAVVAFAALFAVPAVRESAAGSPASTPVIELKSYFSSLGTENRRYVVLKKRTLDTMKLAGGGDVPSISTVRALSGKLTVLSMEHEKTAVRLEAIVAPSPLRSAHRKLIGAVLAASDELADRADTMRTIAEIGKVTFEDLMSFVVVYSTMTKADRLQKEWRVATAGYAMRLGVRPPAFVKTFGTVTSHFT